MKVTRVAWSPSLSPVSAARKMSVRYAITAELPLIWIRNVQERSEMTSLHRELIHETYDPSFFEISIIIICDLFRVFTCCVIMTPIVIRRGCRYTFFVRMST